MKSNHRAVRDASQERQWKHSPGVVYLMRCRLTGEYKVGASLDPATRIVQLVCSARCHKQRELEYVWSVITNAIGRLESYWVNRWRAYRIGKPREWFRLPVYEVAAFCSVSVYNWKDIPPVPEALRSLLSGSPVLPRRRIKGVSNRRRETASS